MHVKKGDEVLVISGRNKDQKGKVKQVLPADERVIVEGVNIVKKHLRQRSARRRSGIIEVEAPLHASKVMLVCPQCNRVSRTGHRIQSDGTKIRFCKACDKGIDG